MPETDTQTIHLDEEKIMQLLQQRALDELSKSMSATSGSSQSIEQRRPARDEMGSHIETPNPDAFSGRLCTPMKTNTATANESRPNDKSIPVFQDVLYVEEYEHFRAEIEGEEINAHKKHNTKIY